MSYETGVVERVIDGDTVVVGNESIRFLGMNTPEKGHVYYEEAKKFLEDLILNKTIEMEKGKEDKDRYERKLRYVFFKGENVNLEIVRQGLANYYFPSGKDKYYKEFQEAWEECINNGKNLCEKSKENCSSCLSVKDLNVKEQVVVFENLCSSYCDLTGYTIKDEGRKEFVFPKFILEEEVEILVGNGSNKENVLYWKGEDYVWTITGDTLFLRDENEKLVLYRSY